MTPLLVFGAQGQVAREIGKIAAGLGFAPTFAGRETVDLIRHDGADLIDRLAPSAVVNAAAYTAVDRAEQEPELAFRLNAEAPGRLAEVCAERHIPFVHISTDYVFDGSKSNPYVEDDPLAPLGVYGASKAAGEAVVLAAQAAGDGRFAIVRTAWVYSAFGANFVKTMLRLARDRDEVGVVADQQGCPTWAEDVARAVLKLSRRLIAEGGEATDTPPARGVFHAAGGGETSWAGFAEAVFAQSAARGGASARVRAITTADFPTPARRPANSRLACERLEAALGWRPADWRLSLAACFDELAASHDQRSLQEVR